MYHLAPQKIFHVFDISHKFATDQENPEYFRISGNRALSHYGGCPGGGGEAPRNVFNWKTDEILWIFSI